MLLLYGAITNVFTHEHLITYLCVDMCECTNQVRSCDYPKQTLLFAHSYIIDHVFVFV